MTTLQQQARALGDPTRHRIFRHLADAGRPVGVAELTQHFGLNHNAIRQHLAKLVEAELVVESTAPITGRGRPRLLYEVAPATDSRWGVTGPYQRLSELLAEIIQTGDSAVEVGRRAGRRLRADPDEPASLPELAEAMERAGFAPETQPTRGRVDVVLENCPFETTALKDPQTVCSLHRGIAEGLVEGSDTLRVEDLVAKDPRRAGCRLRLHVEG